MKLIKIWQIFDKCLVKKMVSQILFVVEKLFSNFKKRTQIEWNQIKHRHTQNANGYCIFETSAKLRTAKMSRIYVQLIP